MVRARAPALLLTQEIIPGGRRGKKQTFIEYLLCARHCIRTMYVAVCGHQNATPRGQRLFAVLFSVVISVPRTVLDTW